MESSCLEVLVRAAENILADSRDFPLNAIDITVKGCCAQKNGIFNPKIRKILEEYTVSLNLKLEKAVPKRKKEKEYLEKLEQEGLVIGSKVRCRDCPPFIKKGCLAKVIGFDHRPFVTIDCHKKSFDLEEVNVDPSALKIVVSKKKD